METLGQNSWLPLGEVSSDGEMLVGPLFSWPGFGRGGGCGQADSVYSTSAETVVTPECPLYLP